jgi:hypothetical protein
LLPSHVQPRARIALSDLGDCTLALGQARHCLLPAQSFFLPRLRLSSALFRQVQDRTLMPRGCLIYTSFNTPSLPTVRDFASSGPLPRALNHHQGKEARREQQSLCGEASPYSCSSPSSCWASQCTACGGCHPPRGAACAQLERNQREAAADTEDHPPNVHQREHTAALEGPAAELPGPAPRLRVQGTPHKERDNARRD